MRTEEKIEELRKSSLWGGSDRCDVCSAIKKEFDRLFPPPKHGCWGFHVSDPVDPMRRPFQNCKDEEEAHTLRSAAVFPPGVNPGPVYFLEEPQS